MADITERIGEGLDALAIVGDGGVPLNKSVKLVAKVDHMRLLVVVEEIGDGGVEGAGGLIIVGHGKGEDRVVDRCVKPALDGVVGLCHTGSLGHTRTVESRKGRSPNIPTMDLKKVLQRVKFGPFSPRVIDTCVLMLMVQKGLMMVGATTSLMSASEEGAPVRATEEEDVPVEAMVMALGF
jgi:hypothetical protein